MDKTFKGDEGEDNSDEAPLMNDMGREAGDIWLGTEVFINAELAKDDEIIGTNPFSLLVPSNCILPASISFIGCGVPCGVIFGSVSLKNETMKFDSSVNSDKQSNI